MKKTILILFLLYYVPSLFCDSLQLAEIHKEINALNQEVRELKNNNDSLSNVNLFYKVKEDYYNTALTNQTTTYGFITASLLAILGIIAYFLFRYELKTYKRDVDKKINEHVRQEETLRKKVTKDLANSYANGGNCNKLVSVHFEEKELIDMSVVFLINAAFCQYCSSKEFKILEMYEEVGEKMRIIKNMLNNVLSKFEDYEIKFSKRDAEITTKKLDEIFDVDYEEIKFLISSVRYKINANISNEAVEDSI